MHLGCFPPWYMKQHACTMQFSDVVAISDCGNIPQWLCVRGTPNFPSNSQITPNDFPNFLQNPVISCDTLWFCVIIYTKVALSHTTDGPLSTCHILSTLIIPSPIPLLCHSIPFPYYFTYHFQCHLYFIFLSYLPFMIHCWLLGSLFPYVAPLHLGSV